MTLLVTLNTLDSSGNNQSFASLVSNDISPDQIIRELTQSPRNHYLKFITTDGFILVKSSTISWVKVIQDSTEE